MAIVCADAVLLACASHKAGAIGLRTAALFPRLRILQYQKGKEEEHVHRHSHADRHRQ